MIATISNVPDTTRLDISRLADMADRQRDYDILVDRYGYEILEEDSGRIAMCFDYAFEHHGHIIGSKDRDQRVDQLLSKHYRIIDTVDPITNDLLIYRKHSGNEKAHAAIYETDGMVRSKWDAMPVFRHSVWMIPIEYGDHVEIHRPI